MIKEKWPGIIGGFLIFLIILSWMVYVDSDFDNHLINEVESGVPEEKLMHQIEKESINNKINIKNHINSHIMNVNMWGNGEIALKNDYEYYELLYENQLNAILELNNIRKQFVKREISKDEFLYKIKYFKEELDRM